MSERLPLWWRTRCGVEPRTLAALALVLLVAAGFAAYHFWAGRPQTVHAPAAEHPSGTSAVTPSGDTGQTPHGPPLPAPAPAAAATSGGAPGHGRGVVVDVAGKVHDPGVHRLPPGSRVADALSAAGGVRRGTDLSGLNRARVLTDGEQIVVGGAPGPPTGGQPAAPGAAPRGANASGTAPEGVPISLSTATAEQLDTLPGVGPVLAQHILDYRTEHGGFRSVDELRDVHGIGARRFADLRPLVRP
ncbi:helix-hairpin-helix domain-containing protein [Streptomyces sp. NPDC018031]|uniref:helix-hairpin-helix domain-containing protein n=1 Tax=Streptomyces sp. NPDC018031 TaxID=3365033 RepID=UPI003795CA12